MGQTVKSLLSVVALVATASLGCGSGGPGVVGAGGSGGTSAAGSGGGAAGTGGPAGSAAAGQDGGAAGSSSDASGAAGATGGAAGSPDQMPTLLSQTGLYKTIKPEVLGDGVHAYQPKYQLWSDGATKRRWVYLPPGTQIDTSDMDFWVYPVGFKLWKEFTRNDSQGKPVRVETRLLMKTGQGAGDWFMRPYKWNADGMDAVAITLGEMNTAGTQHDIPTKEQCGTCHNAMYDSALGFSALQLSHTLDSFNLMTIASMGWLTKNPTKMFSLPGTPAEQNALGYLHSNCGICHNQMGHVYLTSADLDLWTHLNDPAPTATVQATPAYLSSLCDLWPMGADGMGSRFAPITACDAGHATGARLQGQIATTPKRVTPGNAAMSALHELMNERGDAVSKSQMPPVGTEIIDPTGLATLDAWINALPAK